MMDNIREEVKWFAGEMERVLKKNDWKGGWHNCSVEFLFWRLQQEVSELFGNIICQEGNDVTKECVDVANIAMMIADNAKRALEVSVDG